ncbi:MAG: tRNA pseudouridine(38-40) synthase TruA [Lachnospiraceae bacterium]|nr:tRNA pseudouridine(38-40) synthase TruA [Lachnospiraceae bacterium]
MQSEVSGGNTLRNVKLTIAYDGRNYHGWQIQQNALSVQEVFQNALHNIIGDDMDVKGCSRTDTGVHANMYCIGLKTSHRIPAERLKAALNRHLPSSVCVYDCCDMPMDFHPRYDCTRKQYIYKIWNNEVRNPFLDGYALHYRYNNLDVDLLNKACSHYIGNHDYTSFCTPDNRRPGDMHRNVVFAKVERDGDMVTFTVEANGFLYNMVRIMTGTLLRVAQGKILCDDIPAIIGKKNRQFAGPTAPACGLYLNKVYY